MFAFLLSTCTFISLYASHFKLNLIIILSSLVISVISCRAPNPDNVLILQTPLGVISTKSLLQKKKIGSRLISSNRIKQEETPINITEHDPFSAARCRILKRTNHITKVHWRKLLMVMNVCKIKHK